MTFDAAILADKLEQIAGTTGRPARIVVAFSGGLDSTVLLHALQSVTANTEPFASIPVSAVHVDHGLQAQSSAWAEHCRRCATDLEVPFESIAVDVDRHSGKGLEAAARAARYAALGERLQPGEWLLSAHHLDDQAETLLLNLARGSGPLGIAGIGLKRPFAAGWLVRPLLDVSREELATYAAQRQLEWVDDPSNDDTRFDRNYLRSNVMPSLATRWRDISRRLGRSARLAGEAAEMLVELAEIDATTTLERRDRLSIAALTQLSEPRQRNLLRYALDKAGLPMPTAAQLERVLGELIAARDDAQPLVTWPGGSVRRYRDRVYLLPGELAESLQPVPVTGRMVKLGNGLGALRFEQSTAPGLAKRYFDDRLCIRARAGGEEIRLKKQSPTKKLKKLLQEEAVVPWMRDRIPLLFSGDELLAVGDLWLSADAVAEDGFAIRWEGRPALH